MAQWETMVKLFDLTRTMAAEMAEEIPEEQFDIATGDANSPKWIVGHLALGMDFGLMLLGMPTDNIETMMPTYGPGSPGGSIGDDGRSQCDLIAHLRTTGVAEVRSSCWAKIACSALPSFLEISIPGADSWNDQFVTEARVEQPEPSHSV